MARTRFVLLVILLGAFLAQARISSSQSKSGFPATPSRALCEQILSWLPADTETVIGATGPLSLPATRKESGGTIAIEKSGDEVGDVFKEQSLLLLLTLSGNFKDHPIVMAVEGSRDFKPPTGLGMALYQGASISVFASDISASAAEFFKESAATIVQTEQLEGQQVAVFKQKSEEDIWTTYVAFPKPNIAIVATDEDYLREVLARMNGKKGDRALPDSLPEWQYTNTQSEFWAVRHFRGNTGKPSLTSGFGYITGEIKYDNRAIGLAFSFNPEKSKIATVTYLSANENTLQSIQKSLFNEREQGGIELHARYREISRSALEGSYNVELEASAVYFTFVLDALLGHAIAL